MAHHASFSLPDDPGALEDYIHHREDRYPGIKEGAEAKIVWLDEHTKKRTPYSLLYLHGFKASRDEGDPVHREVAKAIGANLFLARLDKHGLEDADAFKELHAEDFIRSAKEAFKIAENLGEKVIIMGTSTGGSLALWMASQPEFASSIAALILYSPLIRFHGIKDYFLRSTAGRALLRCIPGAGHRISSKSGSKEEERIWYSSYPLQGPLALGKLVQRTMRPETFRRVKCPVFVGYYFKNESLQDQVISVRAVRKMIQKLGTPKDQKWEQNFPAAHTHVISNGLFSGSVEKVKSATIEFLQKAL